MVSAKYHQKALDEKDALIDELVVALDKSNSWIEAAQKDPIIKSIGPRLDISLEELQTKGIMELKIMKNALDRELQPSFKSGTKLDGGKTDQRSLLDTTFQRSQKLRLENAAKLKKR